LRADSPPRRWKNAALWGDDTAAYFYRLVTLFAKVVWRGCGKGECGAVFKAVADEYDVRNATTESDVGDRV
jgi:hypothetical protein